ncbi:MAG: metal ABC transporter permease [Sedimentisphaerales bacterium]|nr:metal ABC transporter permease [Sedimentisphaerales bacterium]
MLDLAFWAPVMAGGLVAGGSCGSLSVYIVAMRIPFLGVCVAHAALAGAVFGALAGLAGDLLLWPALGAAVVTSLLLGLADPRRTRMDTNIMMGLLFSVTMGLAFVGFGLFGVLGRSDNDVRSLLWGSLAYCRWGDVRLMLAASIVLGLFLLAFGKEMRAIVFSRQDAAAAGIQATAVWCVFLVLVAILITVNFQTVGGLMIYSLITNPAAAAFQLVRGSVRALLLALVLGGISGLGGFLLSAATDLPSGAVIVLVSSLLVVAAFGWRTLRER